MLWAVRHTKILEGKFMQNIFYSHLKLKFTIFYKWVVKYEVS